MLTRHVKPTPALPRTTLSDKFRRLWAGLSRGSPEPEAEFYFAKDDGRRWRFDFAWPRHKVAVELEGGIWTGGGHTRGSIFNTNCDKYNQAALCGWLVLRYTTNHLRQSPMQMVEQIRAALMARDPHTKDGEQQCLF